MNGNFEVNWAWVKDSLLRGERINAVGDAKKKESIIDGVDASLADAKGLIEAKTRLVKRAVLNAGVGSITIEGGISFSSNDISRYLKGASHIYLFAVTIGGELEKAASSRMAKGDALSGYLLDRIGSYACESLAESVEENLREDYASKGLSVSMRLSPGYCDWAVEEQVKMDKAIDLSAIGISLNKNFMMSPKKSITAIAGIGPKGLFKRGTSQCGMCSKKDCYLRRDS